VAHRRYELVLQAFDAKALADIEDYGEDQESLMQWLVQIADQMEQELECEQPFLKVRIRVFQLDCELIDLIHDAGLGRPADEFQSDIDPGERGTHSGFNQRPGLNDRDGTAIGILIVQVEKAHGSNLGTWSASGGRPPYGWRTTRGRQRRAFTGSLRSPRAAAGPAPWLPLVAVPV